MYMELKGMGPVPNLLGRAWASPTPTLWLGILSLAIYIYRYRGTDRYLWAGAFSPALYFFLARPGRSQAHTEPRITRIPMHSTRLRSRAYCAHTDARPAYLRPAKSTWRPVGSGFFSVSDSIDFNFKKRLNSPERERCRKVHLDACIHSDAQCSSKARWASASTWSFSLTEVYNVNSLCWFVVQGHYVF